MESCQDGNCNSTLLGQTPYWSPDGQQMLLTDLHLFESGQYTVDSRIIALNPESFNQVSPLWLRSASGNSEDAVKIDEGTSPFWITNELFGYIRPVAPSSVPSFQEIVIVSTGDLVPETIIETTAVKAALPENNRSNALIFRYAIAHPTDTDLFLLMASTQANDSYLFQVNRQTQDVKLLFPIDLSRGEHSLGFSPNGRFLVATGTMRQDTNASDSTLPFGALLLYDLESGELKTILTNADLFFPAFTFDWSLDGNWLAFSRDSNVIGLLAPAYDYQQTIILEEGDCTSLAWINPLPAE
jgi:WD40 repeat protein